MNKTFKNIMNLLLTNQRNHAYDIKLRNQTHHRVLNQLSA
jgi:hypothetical protein